MSLRIWIDADACPKAVKELTIRTANRLKIPVCLVADRPISHPDSPMVTSVTVPRGMDSADKYIAGETQTGDIVVTADLPLAAEVVKRGASALDPRGELYTEINIGERLSTRNLLMSLREAGHDLGGPKPFSRKDIQRFAVALDRVLSTRLRS